MAQLNDLIVTGASRFLNKIYCKDLAISGTLSLTGSIDASGRSTFPGGLSVGGYSNTSYALSTQSFISNDWVRVNSSYGVYFQTYGGGWRMTDTNYIRSYGSKKVYMDSGMYTGSNAAYYLDSTGKLNASNVVSPLASINNLTVQTALNASTATVLAGNLTVNDTLNARAYEMSHIMNLGGNFAVSPSFYCTEGSTTVAVAAKTGTKVQLLITDATVITSSAVAGATWYANSKIKLSGIINGIGISSASGTVVRTMNSTTAGTLLVEVELGNQADSFTVGNTFSGSSVSELCVMMYEIYMNVGGTSKTRKIGIDMTAYGTNKASYIDVWSGASDSPNVRLGMLGNTGLPNVNGTAVNGWGLYTTNGYFQGTVVSNAGKIGAFNLSDSLYTGSHNSFASTASGVYIGSDGASFGSNFSVDSSGNVKITALDNITATVSKKQDTPLVNIRYVRDWLNGSTVSLNCHWSELQVIAEGYNIARGITPTGYNSSGATITIINAANITDTHASTYATYNKTTSEWVCIEIDLGEVRNDIDEIIATHYYDDNRSYNHRLQVSSDKTSWVTIFDSDIQGRYAEDVNGRAYYMNDMPIINNISNIRQELGSVSVGIQNAETNMLTQLGVTSDSINASISSLQSNITGVNSEVDSLSNRTTADKLELLAQINQLLTRVSTVEGDVVNQSEIIQDANGWKALFKVLNMYDGDDVPEQQTNISIDANGITITNPLTGQTILMNIDTLRGTYNDEVIFQLQEDATITERVYAERGLEMPTMKLIPAYFAVGNTTYSGVAFVKSGGTS